MQLSTASLKGDKHLHAAIRFRQPSHQYNNAMVAWRKRTSSITNTARGGLNVSFNEHSRSLGAPKEPKT